MQRCRCVIVRTVVSPAVALGLTRCAAVCSEQSQKLISELTASWEEKLAHAEEIKHARDEVLGGEKGNVWKQVPFPTTTLHHCHSRTSLLVPFAFFFLFRRVRLCGRFFCLFFHSQALRSMGVKLTRGGEGAVGVSGPRSVLVRVCVRVLVCMYVCVCVCGRLYLPLLICLSLSLSLIWFAFVL